MQIEKFKIAHFNEIARRIKNHCQNDYEDTYLNIKIKNILSNFGETYLFKNDGEVIGFVVASVSGELHRPTCNITIELFDLDDAYVTHDNINKIMAVLATLKHDRECEDIMIADTAMINTELKRVFIHHMDLQTQETVYRIMA